MDPQRLGINLLLENGFSLGKIIESLCAYNEYSARDIPWEKFTPEMLFAIIQTTERVEVGEKALGLLLESVVGFDLLVAMWAVCRNPDWQDKIGFKITQIAQTSTQKKFAGAINLKIDWTDELKEFVRETIKSSINRITAPADVLQRILPIITN